MPELRERAEVYLSRLQFISLFISLLGSAFKLLHIVGGNIMLAVGLGALMVYYLLKGFLPPLRTAKGVNVHYIRNFSTAILVGGALFYIMHEPDATKIILGGGAGIVLSFILQIVLPDTKGEE